MEIEVYRSRQRLTRLLVKQMPLGYEILCHPFVVHGHVVNILPYEMRTAIIQSAKDYYTLPLDYELMPNKTSCFRKTFSKESSRDSMKLREFVFSKLKFESCRDEWWKIYCEMRDKALQTHIYLI